MKKTCIKSRFYIKPLIYTTDNDIVGNTKKAEKGQGGYC